MLALIFLFAEEPVRGAVASPSETAIENTMINAALWLRFAIETTGAIVIGVGVVIAPYEFIRFLVLPQLDGYTRIRLTLARYLALALESQPGADILSTAIAPIWNQIGKLGAVDINRTALNFFLTREMEWERQNAEDVTQPVRDHKC